MKCIFKADDFGLSHGINVAIIDAYVNGPIKNAGVMINMPAVKEAIDLSVKYPKLSLGLHVNVSVGYPICNYSNVKSLLNKDNKFHSSSYCREKIRKGYDPFPIYEEIEKEVEAQILRYYEMIGRYPDYIDAHAIHSTNLFRALSYCAKKYNIVHYSYEEGLSNNIIVYPYRAVPPYEFYSQGIEPFEYFTKDYCNILNKDYALLFMHPGYIDYELYNRTSYIKVRTQDLYALTHKKTREWLKKNNIESITYKEIEEGNK